MKYKMDNPGSMPTVRPSQECILPDNSFLNSSSAVMIPKTDDGRFFAIPGYDKVVVGTTDTPLDDKATNPKRWKKIEFILHTAGKYLPGNRKKRHKCIFAGLRPLAADPGNPSATKEVSRGIK